MTVRVALFASATLAVPQPDGSFEAVRHFPEPGQIGNAEQQLDRVLRSLASRKRDVSLHVELVAEGGERFEANLVIHRGRFDQVRRHVTEAIVAQAAARRDAALLEQAERLDGIHRTLIDYREWRRIG